VLATVHGRRTLFCCTRQGLVSLDPATGAVNFSYWFRVRQNDSVNAMTPIVQADSVLISSAYFRAGSVLLHINADGKSFEPVWRGLGLEMHWNRPILIGGYLYGFSGRNEPDAHFRCVDWKTGEVKWDRPEGWPNGGHSRIPEGEPMPNVFGRAAAILADGKLIVLGETGLLGLFKPNPEKIEELARWQVPSLRYPCWAGPILANKRLYLRNEDHLVCVDIGK
jgi:outer membrane protein assembly factor BamB